MRKKTCGAKGCRSSVGVRATKKGARCAAHDPARAEARLAASRKGVEARAARRAAALLPKADWTFADGRLPETVRDWQLVGASAARAMWRGELDPRIAKELSSLTRAALASFKVGAMAEKLEEYEETQRTMRTFLERGSPQQARRIAELEDQLVLARAQLASLRSRAPVPPPVPPKPAPKPTPPPDPGVPSSPAATLVAAILASPALQAAAPNDPSSAFRSDGSPKSAAELLRDAQDPNRFR